MQGELRRVSDADPELVAAWHRLAARAIEPNPFFAPEMAIAAARHLAGGGNDQLLTVRDGDELTFALPLRREARYRHLPIACAMAWGHRYTFLGTPLVAPGDPVAAVGEALDALRRAGVALLALERAAVAGPVWEAFGAAAGERGVAIRTVLAFERPIVRRRPQASYLDGRLGTKRRKNLRRVRRSLERELGGQLATRDAAAGEPDAAVERFLALERAGWKGRAGTAVDSDPADGRFFRAAMRAFADADRLRVWTLGSGDVEVAAMCAVEAGDGLFQLKIAHDESHARSSPGMQLELDVLDAFHSEQRSGWIDSCTDQGESPSALLYPDRVPIATLLVALGGVRAAAAVRGLRLGFELRARSRQFRARLRDRSASA